MKKLLAEFLGTAWLVLGGCGSAVLAAAVPEHGIHFAGVALAFGLSVLTMAYAIGHISGCHLNPAVSIGMMMTGRLQPKDLPGYVVAQLLGGVTGAGLLHFIASGKSGVDLGNFACNGYDALSPGGYGMMVCLVTEIVLTAGFLFVILGATDERAPAALAPVAIGLCLTLIHLISIPITNTSVNPARSIATALFAGGTALTQVWLFIVAPVIGAIAGAHLYKMVADQD